MTPDPDRDLVERVQAELPYGTTAFTLLVERHNKRVYARCYAILRSKADAEEATQDAFLAVFRSLGRYRFERPFQHWLSVVVLNSCRMVLRKRASERRRQSALQAEPQATSDTQPDVALRTLLMEILDELEPGMRLPLVMRFVEGFTYREIADELGLSESAVKMRVSRGSRRLRELYDRRASSSAVKKEGSQE